MSVQANIVATTRTRITLSLLTAALFVLVAPVQQQSNTARAADFRHAKKIIVPPSRIPRRYDYDSLNGRVASPSYSQENYSIPYSPPSSSARSTSSSKKNGLVPPPPPVTPSLLPKSISQGIPAPPTRRAVSRHSVSKMEAHMKRSVSSSASFNKSVIRRAQNIADTGHLKDAQALLTRYSKSFPKDQELKHALADISTRRAKYYLRRDNFRDAASQARIALINDKHYHSAREVLNQALRHQGIDPANYEHRLHQGDLLFAQGNLLEAKVEYYASTNLKPNEKAFIGLGNIGMRSGKLSTAKRKYQQALDLTPDSSVALRQLGIVQYKLKDLVGANTSLTRALVQNSKDKIASQHLIDLWQRQVAAHPKNADTHLGLARAYQISGDLKSAQNEYRTVVKLEPKHPNLPAARHSFKLALARQEALAAFQAGQTLDQHGATREAYDKASEAVRLSPGDVKIRLFQAQLLEKLGDQAGARSSYLQVLKRDPKNSTAAMRIKALSASGAVGMKATPLTLSSVPPGNTSTAARGVEEPPLAYLPGPYTYRPRKAPSPDPVKNMTGFLGNLRDLMLKQKEYLTKEEDGMMVKLGVDKPPSSSSSSSVGGIPSLKDILAETGSSSASSSSPDVAGSIGGKKLITSSDIQKIIGGASAVSTSAANGGGTTSAGATGSSGSSTTATTTGGSTPAAASAGASKAGSLTSLAGLALSAREALKSDDKVGSLASLAVQSAPTLLSNLGINKAAPASQTRTESPAGTRAGTPKPAPTSVKQSQPPTVAPAISSSHAVVPTKVMTDLQQAYKKLGTLEAQNRQLLTQLNQAHTKLSTMKAVSAPQSTPVPSPLVAAPLVQGSATRFTNPSSSSVLPATIGSLPASPAQAPAARVATSTSNASSAISESVRGELETPQTITSHQDVMPPLAPPIQKQSANASAGSVLNPPLASLAPEANASAGSVLNPPLASLAPEAKAKPVLRGKIDPPATSPPVPSKFGAVRLELLGVKASKKDIRLNVVIKNDKDTSLKIPSSTRALVRIAGAPDKPVKIKFPKKTLAAHATMRGTIKIPGQRLSPAADVLIPGLDMAKDVHLTVPISSLSNPN